MNEMPRTERKREKERALSNATAKITICFNDGKEALSLVVVVNKRNQQRVKSVGLAMFALFHFSYFVNGRKRSFSIAERD